MTESLRVLVVDDHPLFREGVVATLGRASSFLVVGEASSGRQAAAQASALRPDIVLLDVGLPDGRGVEFVRPILDESPLSRVVMLTVADDNDTSWKRCGPAPWDTYSRASPALRWSPRSMRSLAAALALRRPSRCESFATSWERRASQTPRN